MAPLSTDQPEFWPPLPLEPWKETYGTLHMWTQMVGKVRLKLTPLVNHWWNVPLYVTARGLTTLPIRYRQRSFELSFDFKEHRLQLETSDGLVKTLPLVSRTVAEFYQEFMDMLWSADIAVRIWKMPTEIPNPIPFDQDRLHAAYDPEYAQRFWQILLTVHDVFGEFRSRFIGKCSPVHFFSGSFDLAVTRFSGRPAPERPGAAVIMREAYSYEVSSVGFWPGGGNIPGAAFYSYSAPEPPGFRQAAVRPDAAFYDTPLGEFLLMYDDVRQSDSPTTALLDFCQSTYSAAATHGRWDRQALERPSGAATRQA